MMKKNFLIVGQGIAGTMLCHELLKLGHQVRIVQNNRPITSYRAGGILHPLSPRTFGVRKEFENYISYALRAYLEIASELGIAPVQKLPVYLWRDDDAEPQPNDYLEIPSTPEMASLLQYFSHAGDVVKLNAWHVQMPLLLGAVRQYLSLNGFFLNENFRFEDCFFEENKITFRDYTADKIILCEGAGRHTNPFFHKLQFIRNQGNILVLNIPGLPENAAFENGVRLVPKGNGIFWCGSNHTWNADNIEPDLNWQKNTLEFIGSWLKLPVHLISHEVGLRPTTPGQFPYIGLCPQQQNIGIFNGLGTKGIMQAPWWAKQFAAALHDDKADIEGYDNERFRGYLL